MLLRKPFIGLLFLTLLVGTAYASTDTYVDYMNIYAKKNFDYFKKDLRADFGLSNSRFEMILKKVDSPGDLAVALWLGKKTSQSIDEVIKQYRIHHGKGWGLIAQKLGVKPGSQTFQVLKAGRLDWQPREFEKVVREEKIKKAKQRKEKRLKEKGR